VMAVDGEQAVAMSQSEKPDLILMDMSLPVIDGWEATRRVKSAESSAHIPIIALTAHSPCRAIGRRRLAPDATTTTTKPIEMPRLLEKIDALLARP